MGIGRRDFLAMFGSTLASLAAQPWSAVAAVADDLYLNRKLGIAFRKPRAWHFADIRDMGKLASGQLLAIDDPAINELFTSAEALPLVTVSQESLAVISGRFTPGISAFVEALPAHEPSAIAVAAEDLSYLPRFLRDVKPISPPVATRLSNSDAAEHRVEFQFEHQQLREPTRVTMRTLLIHQVDRQYTFRMYDSGAARVDFSAFVESICVM